MANELNLKEPNQEDNTLSLLDIASVFVRHRWLIIGTTATAAVLVFIFSVYTMIMPDDSPLNFLPNFFRPKITVMIQDSGSSLSSQVAKSAIDKLMGGGGGSSSTSVELTKQLIAGNTLKDVIIQEFALIKKYKLEQSQFALDDARNLLQKNLEVAFGETAFGPNGIITVGYKDIDPVFARKITDRVVEILGERFDALTQFRVHRKKQFIEERMSSVERELKKAEQAMEKFQIENGVIDISTQAKEQARLLATQRSDVLAKELEINTLRSYLSADDPKIVRLKKEMDKKNELIDELTNGFKRYQGEFVPQNKVPNLVNQFAELNAEAEVQSKIYSTLRQEYEMVKLEEADNTQTFQVIEPSEVPAIKAGPYRPKICITITLLAFIFSTVIAFIRQYFANASYDPVESRKLENIKGMLWNRQRKQ